MLTLEEEEEEEETATDAALHAALDHHPGAAAGLQQALLNYPYL